MLMVILGAGASYDSTPRYPPGMGLPTEPRPPMIDGLFDTRFKGIIGRFPECRPLVPFLDSSVEDTLQRFQAEASEDPELYKPLMAIRHYLPWVVGDCEQRWLQEHGRITNQAALLSRINLWCTRNRERACVVTFNYDTFIEQAFLDTLRITMVQLGEYIASDRYKVIKLHGSVTWFHEVESPAIADVEHRNAEDIARELIARGEEVRASKGFRVGDRTTIGKAGDRGPAVIPAIAAPVLAKPEFECPIEHVKALEVCLPSVSAWSSGGRGGSSNFLRCLKWFPVAQVVSSSRRTGPRQRKSGTGCAE
jgi:hypothetical protein